MPTAFNVMVGKETFLLAPTSLWWEVKGSEWEGN